MPVPKAMQSFEAHLRLLPQIYSFEDWLTSTRELQEVAYDAHYDEMSPDIKADSMMMNHSAAVIELGEMMEEMGWKPWVQPRGWINREAAIKEAVDVLHFLGNLLTHAQCTGKELTDAYRAKQLKNLQRQIEGYDGRYKCANCHRALDDGTVAYQVGGTDHIYCSKECCNEKEGF